MNNRKILNIMREFIIKAMDDKMLYLVDDGCELISFEPLIINHNVRPVRYGMPRVSFYKERFCIYKDDDDKGEVIKIGYDEDFIHDNLSKYRKKLYKAARKSMTLNEPHMNGFATITLLLLHELGHLEAERGRYTEWEEEFSTRMIKHYKENNLTSLQYNNEIHFNLPAEIAATTWAIDWLRHPKNAKIAKDFERKFFKCVRES